MSITLPTPAAEKLRDAVLKGSITQLGGVAVATKEWAQVSSPDVVISSKERAGSSSFVEPDFNLGSLAPVQTTSENYDIPYMPYDAPRHWNLHARPASDAQPGVALLPGDQGELVQADGGQFHLIRDTSGRAKGVVKA